MQKRFHSKEAAPYRYKNKPVEPKRNAAAASTVTSGCARGAATDLRALIVSNRVRRNSKALRAVRAKEFKNGYNAEHNSITLEVMFQTRQKRLQSDYSFEVHRIVSGDKVTVILNGKEDSNNNVVTLTGPVRVGHTQKKHLLESGWKIILQSTALTAVVT
jgi:hypothetical protein